MLFACATRRCSLIDGARGRASGAGRGLRLLRRCIGQRARRPAPQHPIESAPEARRRARPSGRARSVCVHLHRQSAPQPCPPLSAGPAPRCGRESAVLYESQQALENARFPQSHGVLRSVPIRDAREPASPPAPRPPVPLNPRGCARAHPPAQSVPCLPPGLIRVRRHPAQGPAGGGLGRQGPLGARARGGISLCAVDGAGGFWGFGCSMLRRQKDDSRGKESAGGKGEQRQRGRGRTMSSGAEGVACLRARACRSAQTGPRVCAFAERQARRGVRVRMKCGRRTRWGRDRPPEGGRETNTR